MTKEDSIVIADGILQANKRLKGQGANPHALSALNIVAQELSNVLKADNPRFDSTAWFSYLNKHEVEDEIKRIRRTA